MKFYCVEWFDDSQGKYNQEYFSEYNNAFARFKMLADSIGTDGMGISTLHMED